MSLPDEEARALDRAFRFLLELGSAKKISRVSELRAEARDIVHHFPLAAGIRWLDFHGIEEDE